MAAVAVPAYRPTWLVGDGLELRHLERAQQPHGLCHHPGITQVQLQAPRLTKPPHKEDMSAGQLVR